MPRNNDPGTIRVGSGKAPALEGSDLDLTGAGMAGAGPNIGAVAGELPLIVGGPDPNPPTCLVLDDGGGLLQPPPTTGNFSLQTTFTGIPDWGVLKLADATLVDKGVITSAQTGQEIFPYYQGPPSPALDNPPFSNPGPGSDPETDPRWNSAVSGEVMSVDTVNDVAGSLDGVYWIFYASPTDAYYVWYTNGTAVDPAPVPPAGVTYTGIQVTFVNGNNREIIATLTKTAIDGATVTGGNPTVARATYKLTLTNALQGAVPDVADGAVATGFAFATDLQGFTGSGIGATFSGGFTRVDPTYGPVIPTDRILSRTSVLDGPLPERQQVVFSGSLFPADRGVLGLIHWPAGGTTTEFLAQPLLDRCVAAILLGQGLRNATPELPDGGLGGIFGAGEDSNGDLDPFAYPGQATGQYNLNEIVLGQSAIDSVVLTPPWDDWDGDTVQGAQRVQNSNIPGPGQVRLGSDPSAGEPAEPYGIPVLGAGTDMYSPPLAGPLLGNSAVIDANFFGYRLPYLDDYSSATGLKYTPRGVDAAATRETNRYFFQETPNQDSPTVVTLPTAGAFPAFAGDNVNWQVARYRHAFMLPSTVAVGAPEDVGSYFMVHFKTEANFEDFVRDGILPDDPTNGYETYSARLDSSALSLEGTLNVVNEFTGTATPPAGPAPAYGYDAAGYHVARTSVFLDPRGDGDVVDVTGITATFDWGSDSSGGVEIVMWVSGVAYFSPISPLASITAFRFTDFLVNLPAGTPGFWEESFRTSSLDLSSGIAPAQLASPNPAFISIAPFSYNLTGPLPGPTYSLPAFNTAPGLVFPGRWEYTYEYLGYNANGVFSPTNGPRPGDDLEIALLGGDLDFNGDQMEPAFTQDAKLRVYFRKPTAHTTADTTVQPFSPTDGHGLALTPTPAGPILFHSSGFTIGGLFKAFPLWGNFKYDPVTLGKCPSTVQQFAKKDSGDRFLDEIYRWRSDWHADVGVAVQAHLVGPGLHGVLGATATIGIVTAIATNTVTIGGVVFTAVNGGAVAANQQFNDVPFTGTNALTLQSLDATINDPASQVLIAAANVGVSATSNIVNPGTDTTLTLTATVSGVSGELGLATNDTTRIRFNGFQLAVTALAYTPHPGTAVVVPLVAGGAEPPWDTSSWVRQNLYRVTLEDANPQDIELQVMGLPDRNPPISEGVQVPFPSRGLLGYPHKDYTAVQPSLAAGKLATAQRDYSAATGVRSFVRTYDAGFKRSNVLNEGYAPVGVEGQTFFHMRIDGLSLQDFTYAAPGPGGLAGASGISIMVKVPGTTAWMDLGRVDGSGPSKQDIGLDGAGCQVAGLETFDAIDPTTGIVYCQVKVNTGPVASLFFANNINHRFTNTSGVESVFALDYVPVLVKVVMDVAGAAYNLEEGYTGVPGGFTPGAAPGLPWVDTRGIMGINIVHPDDVGTS